MNAIILQKWQYMKVIVLIALVFGSVIGLAEDLAERPNLKGGKLFTVELFPKGKSLEIEVVGKEVVDAKMTNLGLVAQLHIGKKIVLLTPIKRGNSFHLAFPLL